MAPRSKTRFTNTVKALKREESSAWAVVDAIGKDVEFSDDGFPHGELTDMVEVVMAAGVDRSKDTLFRYAHAARMLHLAHAKDIPTLKEGTSASALGELGRGGYTPEGIVSEIKFSHGKISKVRASALVAALKSGDEPPPERDKWANVDTKVRRACNTIVEALGAERTGEAELDPATWTYIHFAARAMSVSTADMVDIEVEADAGIAAIEEFING